MNLYETITQLREAALRTIHRIERYECATCAGGAKCVDCKWNAVLEANMDYVDSLDDVVTGTMSE